MRGRTRALLCIGALLLTESAGNAQEERRGASPLNLPRPGYEPVPIRSGNTVISLELETEALYDSNVFAQSQDEMGDAVINARPRVEVVNENANWTLRGEGYGNIRRFLDLTRENSETYGAAAIADYRFGSGHAIRGEARFDHEIESRADPERRAGALDRPRQIDIPLTQIQYTYTGNRLGLGATAAVQRYNYLASAESDRDMTVYRGSVQASLEIAAPFRVFGEAYVNRRDFDEAADLSGVNRDTTSYGMLIGGLREITGRLRGRLGAGVFRSEPKDPQLEAFTGVSVSGDLTWSPRARTAITAQVFRGDVATVRSGASGRVDTRASLRLDQEARHNLMFSVIGGVRNTQYRGLSTRDQTTFSADFQVDYLLNRAVSVFGFARWASRSANVPTDEFDRSMIGVGVRLRR